MIRYNRPVAPTPMSDDQIRRVAPSVFTASPWSGVSSNYRFIPTIEVLRILQDRGYQVMRASQGKTRIPGKGDFTKHMLRLRHSDYLVPTAVGSEIPEVVLTNAHDRTSAYNFRSGIFRLVCSNGLVVQSEDFGSFKLRHSGQQDLQQQVIEATYKVVEDTPKVMAQIAEWKGIQLNPPQQIEFARSALELAGKVNIEPAEALRPRQMEDRTESDGSRDLWRTMNVVQQNTIQGGMRGRTPKGRKTTTKAIKSVTGDLDINKKLWAFAERVAKLMA